MDTLNPCELLPLPRFGRCLFKMSIKAAKPLGMKISVLTDSGVSAHSLQAATAAFHPSSL